MTYSIRGSILAVALLGVATCALALYSLAGPLAMTEEHRTTRARDAVALEVQRLAAAGDLVEARSEVRTFGLRSGLLGSSEDASDIAPAVDPEVLGALHEVIAAARVRDTPVTLERNAPSGVVFVGAARAVNGKSAWAAHLQRPAQLTPVLRVVGALLVATSIALVLAALYAVSSVGRGARSLLVSLSSLGKDLSSPVPLPEIRELAEVGGGIASLARELSMAQVALAERERLAVLGRVTAGVAHEIRNPLAAIKLRVDMALKTPHLDHELEADLGDIGAEVARLNRLVGDLLTVAKRKTGPREELELGAFARRRADLLAPFASERGVRLEVSGTATATVDGDALARAVDNLLRNAVEASPRGECIQVVAEARDGRSCLRVLDRGEGVPEDRQVELFEPFFTTKSDGVGLGLALSKAIAEAHGGTLSYVREGNTSIFALSLPEAEA